MEIDVIDTGDPDLGRSRHRWLTSLGPPSARIELCSMEDTARLVSEVSRLAAPRKLRVLRIWSDRPPGTLRAAANGERLAEPGSLQIPSTSFVTLSKEVGILHPLFARGAHAELRGYGFGLRGNLRPLLQSLARVWGVPIQAGPLIRTTGDWCGPVVQAMPDGALALVTGARVWSRN